MIQESYKGKTITATAPRNKRGTQIVWITNINSKQVYKVFANIDKFLDEKETYEAYKEALEDCKQTINMEEINEEIVTATTETPTAMEDPAEANVCDSCQ